jgi:multidrug efflux pump subunit AcrA (membrane-fusion protein)
MGRTIRGWIVTAIILIVVIGGGGFLALNLLRPRVQVTRAVTGPVVQAFYSTGTVQPVREYPIKANHAGIITKLLVDKGHKVTEGQPLAYVEEKELQHAFDKAKAELTEKLARADDKASPVLKEFDARILANTELLEIAKRDEKRLLDLSENNAASFTDLDRAADRTKTIWANLEGLKAQRSAKLLELQREVKVAESGVATAQWNLDQQTIRSPINGVVLDWPASIGTRLAVNDHIMQVADVRPESLVMRAQVDEEDKTKVRLDQIVRMTLYAFPGEVFDGKVKRIYDKADADRRTFEVDVEMAIPNANLAAGMTGELAFVMADKEKATVIPSQALQKNTVYVVRNGKIAAADVKVGLQSIERVEIVSGLLIDDRVLLTPIGSLKPGRSVRMQEIDPVAAANMNKKAIEEHRKVF